MSLPQPLKKLSFTVPGFALFVIALVMLVRALAARNAYEIALSLAALALLLALRLAGALAVRRLATLEPVWNFPLPLGAGSGAAWTVSSQSAAVPLFFRLHFLVRGRFFPQGAQSGCRAFAETSLSRRGGVAQVRLGFPLGGVFRGETSCALRDIFGFFSFPCGVRRERALGVRSAPCGVRALRIDAQSGAEDRRNKSSSDEERYYMREYAPGDRFRDINWKSSERISTLVTRISPDNQEKITRIEVHFRNYGLQKSLADLWLLDRAKARLAWFLRKLKEEKSSYVFHVRSAGASWDLNDDAAIEAFLEELTDIPFLPAQNEDAPQTTGEVYVFSTACDTALPAFLLARQGRPFSLFLAQMPPRLKGTRQRPEAERLYLRDFLAGGCVPLLRWLPPKPQRVLPVSAGRLMIDYAETAL